MDLGPHGVGQRGEERRAGLRRELRHDERDRLRILGVDRGLALVERWITSLPTLENPR